MTYCKDSDMKKYRPNILDLGVSDWESQRNEAYEMINRVITARWYREAAKEMGYDPDVTEFNADYVEENTFVRLEAFKALELAYMHLMKDGQEADGFERAMKLFRNRFNEELDLLLGIGINYDWSGSGLVDDDEKYIRPQRRLHRS
jgi:hypothetical protein